jgi:hypothetical protein
MSCSFTIRSATVWCCALLVACSATTSSTTETPATADAASTTLVDVHAHTTLSGAELTASSVIGAMNTNNVSTMVMMSTPMATTAHEAFGEGGAELLTFYTGQSGIKIMYGGAMLNPLLHAVGRGESFTQDLLYPNGGTQITDADVATMNTIAGDPDTYETTFKARATAAATSGSYVGFGELSPLHYSLRSGHPSVQFAANHAWMLWLADLGATHSMPLDIHIEADSTALAQFEVLLAHNRTAKIIWDHVGWYYTDVASAEAITTMMANHTNLYLSVKLRDAETDAQESASPLSSGTIKDAWKTLLETYSDRIMVGIDAKFSLLTADETTLTTALASSASAVDALLAQIDASAATKIRSTTATTLFP